MLDLGKWRRRRRGSSLLLVTTAMGAAVILSGAYLASRANGALVGGNLSSSSMARIQTESALAVTSAALTGSGDWRTDHAGGLYLMQETPDSVLKVELIDLATNQPPTAETVDVRANITARQGGIERFAQADFFIPLEDDAQAVNVDLGEFALFAGESIELGSEALVQTWEASPGAGRGEPVKVATGTGDSRGVQLLDSSMIVGGIEYRPMQTAYQGGTLPINELPSRVIVHQPPPPVDHESALLQGEVFDEITGELRIGEVDMGSGDQLSFGPGANLIVEGNLRMQSGSTLEIRGSSALVVKGDLTIQGGIINVDESAELNVYVGGDLDLVDAQVIEPNGTDQTWVPKINRVNFMTNPQRESIPHWRIRGRSLFKGQLYAPSAHVSIEQRSVVIGRIAAQRIVMSGCACLLYDPTIDNRNGYTAPDGRLFEQDGKVLEPISKMDDLSSEQLQKASLEMGVAVAAGIDVAHPPQSELAEEDSSAERYGGKRRWWHKQNRWNRMGSWRNMIYARPNSSMRIRGIGMNAQQFKEHGR